jgi:DNA-binding transcriptional LysR family regulator
VNPWFESLALPSDDVLAACRPSLPLGSDGMIDIVALAPHPLLLLDSGYSVRRLFNAACRVADVEPNILLESRAPHTLLALAEAGQGVAILPSVLRTDRYRLKNRPGQPPAKTAARPLCHPMGQAPSHAKLCPEFLRRARRVYARGATYYAAVIRHGAQTRAVMISCLDVDLG